MLTPVDQQYAQFKDKYLTPFLSDVPSQVLRNGEVRFMGAMQRFWNGLAERPNYKKKSGRQTVWLTSELFKFKPTGKTNRKQDRTIYDHKLMLGTFTHSLGELCFKAYSEYALPASITITREVVCVILL
jgi:putative transposase